MSDQEKNTGRTDDMDFSALDEELARMAEETPEVPEDFHENWTRMIREEAAAGKPETETAEPRKVRGQLRYIMSVAAAFVILIGGVVLARNNGLLQEKTNAPGTAALTANTLVAGNVQEAAETAEEAADASAEQVVLMGMGADAMTEPMPEEGMLSAKAANGSAPALKAEAAEAVQQSEPEAPMLMATANPTAVPVPAMSSGTPDTGDEAEAAAEPEPADTAAGETETEEAAAEKPADPVPDPEPDDAAEDSRSFLQKAWEGLLNAVPWILGGAIVVLFILTYVVRPGGKK